LLKEQRLAITLKSMPVDGNDSLFERHVAVYRIPDLQLDKEHTWRFFF
jgi:hypothetical protein